MHFLPVRPFHVTGKERASPEEVRVAGEQLCRLGVE